MLSIAAQKNIKSIKGDCVLEIELSLNANSLIGIYGNSGEGKTTLFNIIAGLVTPEKGIISWQGKKWFSGEEQINIPTQHRNIGYIFQRNNLFPHFTVKENILYAVPKAEQPQIDVAGLLEGVEMGNMADRYPHELSGGQAQRIAIARALAQKASILLMDEPFSALDLEIKHKLYKLIKKFKKEHQLMMLMITHDINDLSGLCDEVAWIRDHKVKGTQSHARFKQEIEEKIKLL